jgi:hypothetical protein
MVIARGSTRSTLIVAVAVALMTLLAPERAHAVEGMVSVGVSQPVDEAQDRYGWGGFAALSVGGELSDLVSLHGRADVHYLNVNDSSDSGSAFMVSALPLFHLLRTSGLRLELGPWAGAYWGNVASAQFKDVEGRATGFHLGALVALLFETRGRVTLGPVLTYSRMFPSEACARVGALKLEVCDDDPEEFGYLSLGLGLWF